MHAARWAGWSVLAWAALACNKGEAPAAPAVAEPSAQGAASAAEAGPAVRRFGGEVPAGEPLALATIAADPEAYRGKRFLTSGTITAVCQHRGCWLTLEAEGGEAFVRIADHAFSIPKDASGHPARVFATLDEASLPSPGEATCRHSQGGCKAEAATATGKPLAKLELLALGVELR